MQAQHSVVVPEDSLSRFLFSDRDFKAAQKLVKERAFRPRELDDDLSVFRTTGQSSEEIWNVGRTYVLPERKAFDSAAKIHGRADFNAIAPISQGLTLRFDEPPPQHVLMEGWPQEKHVRMQIAQELAARAFLELPLTPIAS